MSVGWIAGAGAQFVSQEARQAASSLAREAAAASLRGTFQGAISAGGASFNLVGGAAAAGASSLDSSIQSSIRATQRSINSPDARDIALQDIALKVYLQSNPVEKAQNISSLINSAREAVARRAAQAGPTGSEAQPPPREQLSPAGQGESPRDGAPEPSPGEGIRSPQTRDQGTMTPDRHDIRGAYTLSEGYGDIAEDQRPFRALEIFEADLMRSDRLTGLFLIDDGMPGVRNLPGHVKQVQDLLNSLDRIPRQPNRELFNRILDDVKALERRIYARIEELWNSARNSFVRDPAFGNIATGEITFKFKRSSISFVLQ